MLPEWNVDAVLIYIVGKSYATDGNSKLILNHYNPPVMILEIQHDVDEPDTTSLVFLSYF